MRTPLACVLVLGVSATSLLANFHVMQIEQIIGGINGDTTAQAIQLRMRTGGQNVVNQARIFAYNATGTGQTLLLDLASDVSHGSLGDNVLLTTASFDSYMAGVPGYTKDFTLAAQIPAGYLNGGKVTFEDNFGTIYWSVAFGSYTGSNTGNTTNDSDGNFGAPFSGVLPSSSRQGIRFTGTASALSTTNVADYALTANPATVRNNAGSSFTVVPEPGSISFVALGAAALGGIVFARRRR